MSKEPTIIAAFGDSITMGAWDSKGGWVSRLWFNDKSRIVYNLGIDGNTVIDVLYRFELEVINRGIDQDSIIIFAVGINDSSRVKGKIKVDTITFALTLNRLIILAQKYSNHVFCLGLTPIEQTKTNPVCWDNTLSFLETDRQKYTIAIETVAKERKVTYILLPKIALSEDGVHPNNEGHAVIAYLINSAINKTKESTVKP